MSRRAPLTLDGASALTGPIGDTHAAGGGIVSAVTAIAAAETSAALSDLAEHPDNPRSSLGDLAELTASIVGSGVIEPLVVVTAAAWQTANPGRGVPAGRWVVIAGHRRLAASRQAGVERVPIHVRDDLAAPDATATAMLIENIHRADLPPLDEAAALARLAASGLSQREVSRRTGISQPKISKRLALLTLPERAKTGLASGELTVTDALRLLDLPSELHESTYREACQQRIPLTRVIDLVRKRLASQARDAQLATDLTARGIRIIDPDKEFGQAARWQHHLWRDDDVADAEAAGILLACIGAGRVEYYAATPPPWPWQLAAGPGESDPSDSGAVAPSDEDPAAAADLQPRLDLIRAALAEPMTPHRQLHLLVRMTLLPSYDAEDRFLARDLLGRSHPALDDDDEFDAIHPGPDPARTALAVAFARREQWMPIYHGERNSGVQTAYLSLLADELGYTRTYPE